MTLATAIPTCQGGGVNDPGTEHRSELVIGVHALHAGPESVGLPESCSSETLLVRYLMLIRIARTGSLSDPVELRADDLEVLGRAAGLAPEAIRRRLSQLLEPAAA
jgi:hypothetical protein